MLNKLICQDGGNHHNHSYPCCSEHSFNCPEFLPARVPNDLFCTPLDCPDRIPTPRFSSPNSPLPPEELADLKVCIEMANELLRTLGNPRDPANLTALRLHFRRLRGTLIRATTGCGEDHSQHVGCLQESGRDFLQLEAVGQTIFIPFAHLCSVHRPATCEHGAGHEQELIGIDQCLRRSLVLNFSEAVAGNPHLINLFFGIQLHLQLLTYLGCKAIVKTTDGPELIQGTLVDSAENYLQLLTDNQIRQINFSKVCFVKL